MKRCMDEVNVPLHRPVDKQAIGGVSVIYEKTTRS